jgi:hypothetical protein
MSTEQEVIERQVAALGTPGPKYCKASRGVIVLWHGTDAVNAYRLPGWEQIGHWNIDFGSNTSQEQKLVIVEDNIDRHLEEESYPW